MAGEGDVLLEVLVAVQELANGGVSAFPVAAPELEVFDLDGEWEQELRRALETWLQIAPAQRLAPLTLWRGELLEVPLELDLRRRGNDRGGALHGRYPCVVRTDGKDRWVRALGLDHDFWVGPQDDLEALARQELRRCLNARLAAGDDPLALLPPLGTRLALVPIAGRGRAQGRGAEPKQRDRELLAGIGTPLRAAKTRRGGKNAPADTYQPRPDDEERLRPWLLGKRRTPLLVVGPAGSGKSALLRHLLAGRGEVYLTSGFTWVAGQSMLGQLQERVRQVMAAAERLDAILYFERFEELLTGRGGPNDLLAQLRPYLDAGKVRLLCELDEALLDEAERGHAGFFASLRMVRIAALDAAATRAALDARLAARGGHAAVDPDVAAPLLELCQRYFPDRAWPGMPLGLLDELESRESGRQGPEAAVAGRRELYRLVGERTGIPEFLLRDDQALRREQLRESFRQGLIGQAPAVEQLIATLCAVKARLQPEGRPLAVLLFVGPTGVGKTEAARCLARLLFGDAERLVRFDMSEYADPWAAERLIRGSDREEGLLTRRIRREPFAVILLDEIEKADRAVFDLLLQVAGEGRLSDARGRTVAFHNTILVMTSNLGARERGKRFGFGEGGATSESRDREQVEQFFRPELVNRLDRVISFLPLEPEELKAITRLQLAAIGRRRGIEERGLRFETDERVVDHLAAIGAGPHGARRLRRHLQQAVVAPAAALLAENNDDLDRRGVLVVRHADTPGSRHPQTIAQLRHGALSFELRNDRLPPERDYQALLPLQELRRLVHRLFHRGQLEILADEAAGVKRQLFTLQLQAGGQAEKSGPGREGGAKASRLAAEIARLSQRLHRLETLLAPLRELSQELSDSEELALGEWLAGQPIHGWADQLASWRRTLRLALGPALLAPDELASCTLLAAEGDGERGLDLWLGSLLHHAGKAGWQLLAWPQPLDPKAEPERLGPAELLRWLQLPERSRSLLLEVQGGAANARLRWEAGWHRFVPPEAPEEGAHVVVERIARVATTANQRLQVLRNRRAVPPSAAELRKLPILRDWRLVGSTWQIKPATVPKPLGGHWRAVAELPAGDITLGDYWSRLDEILTIQLLPYELDDHRDRDGDRDRSGAEPQ